MNINFKVLSTILSDIEQIHNNQTGETVLARFEYFSDKSGCIELVNLLDNTTQYFLGYSDFEDLKNELENCGFGNDSLFDSEVSMENLDKALENIENSVTSDELDIAYLVYFSSGQGKISVYNFAVDSERDIVTFVSLRDMEIKLRELSYWE